MLPATAKCNVDRWITRVLSTSTGISNGNRTEWSPIRSAIKSDNKLGRLRSGSPICTSRVWLQAELDDTKSYYQLIIKITISGKRRIPKLLLWKKGKIYIKKTDNGDVNILRPRRLLMVTWIRRQKHKNKKAVCTHAYTPNWQLWMRLVI